VHAVRTHKSPWSDSSDQNGGSPSPRAPNGNGAGDRSWSRSPRFSEEYYNDNSDDEGDSQDGEEDSGEEELRENGGSGCGEYTSSNSGRKLKKSEKRRKFQEARKAHYGMKDALRKAKELLEHEIEDEERLDQMEADVNGGGDA
jgi:hypothetical protein